jgi:L-ascorbate metabolism protein UlaG (beta-lactamase superfamily)
MKPDRVTYVGHATVLLELGGARLLTDPVLRRRIGPLRRQWPVPDGSLAAGIDAVLLSHMHHDHLDLPSLRRLGHGVPIVSGPGSAEFLGPRGFTVTELAPGESTAVGGVEVSAVEARHEVGSRLRPGPSEAVGFRLAATSSVYFAGDTDLFDGMAALGELDLALLPVWGWGTSLGAGHLDPERAARAAAMLSPRIAVPIHWGTYFPLGLSRLRPRHLREPPAEFERLSAERAPQVEVRVLLPGASTALSA